MSTKEINLKIHEEADLYSAFDPEQKLLSEDVTEYLARNYLNKHRSLKEKYVIHIISDGPVNEEKVRKNFAEYFTVEKDNISYEIKKLRVKEFGLALFGVLILGLWAYLSVTSQSLGMVRSEILSIVGWVAIWEATSIVIKERPELIAVRNSYNKIINAQILFHVVPDQDAVQ